ncbi:glycosyltransferase [Naviculisporaceae sp. PSN 640]
MTTSTLEASSSEKPIVVAAGFPASGHSKNLVQVCNHLSRRGFTVYCITAAQFKTSLERNGVEFIDHPFQLEGRDGPPAEEPTMSGPRLFVHSFTRIFVDSMPTAHQLINTTLEEICIQYPSRKVVILHEVCFMGLFPYYYGAPLPKGYTSMPPVLSIHTSLDTRYDLEVPPFGPGLPYDPTPENLALWRHIYKEMEPVGDQLNTSISAVSKSLGATRDVKGFLLEALYEIGSAVFLFTTVSTDYPPRRKPSKIRYIGALPIQPPSPELVYPEWWDSVLVSNAALPSSSPEKKKVVFITQGTVHINYDELLIPALKAFSSRPDLDVMAVLGVKGGKLTSVEDPNFTIPSNAHILDYFPYDVILPFTDVFVTNAGYNGYMHGIMNGVPMIMAGEVADKAETSARAEYAGIAVNLRTPKPTEEMLLNAVDKILSDGTFKEKIMVLKAENEACDPFGDIERAISEEATKCA